MTEKSAIAEYLNGTSRCVSDAANYFGVDEDEVLAALAEEEVEECANCGWWFSTDELEVDGDGEYRCSDCHGE